jgi:hypothetical protein
MFFVSRLRLSEVRTVIGQCLTKIKGSSKLADLDSSLCFWNDNLEEKQIPASSH